LNKSEKECGEVQESIKNTFIAMATDVLQRKGYKNGDEMANASEDVKKEENRYIQEQFFNSIKKDSSLKELIFVKEGC